MVGWFLVKCSEYSKLVEIRNTNHSTKVCWDSEIEIEIFLQILNTFEKCSGLKWIFPIKWPDSGLLTLNLMDLEIQIKASKCHHDEILDIQISVCYEHRTRGFWSFISENLRPPLIFLVPSLGWEMEKRMSFSQKLRTGWNYNNNKCGKLHEYMSQSFCYSLCELL